MVSRDRIDVTFCSLLIPLWESVIVLCFVVRYFMSILVLQSSWWGGESWLLCFICLPGVSWWLSGSSSRCHGVVCSLWLWYFLIILTYYFWLYWFLIFCALFFTLIQILLHLVLVTNVWFANKIRLQHKLGKFGQSAKFGQRPCFFQFWIIGIKIKFTKQTVEILMRRHIWIFTVCKTMSEFTYCLKLPDFTLLVCNFHNVSYFATQKK